MTGFDRVCTWLWAGYKTIKSPFQSQNNSQTDRPYTIVVKLYFSCKIFNKLDRWMSEVLAGCPNLGHTTLNCLPDPVLCPGEGAYHLLHLLRRRIARYQCEVHHENFHRVWVWCYCRENIDYTKNIPKLYNTVQHIRHLFVKCHNVYETCHNPGQSEVIIR